jgi:hypothetical protein
MAVPPPFDRLSSLPTKAVNKLSAALNKLIAYLKRQLNKLLEKANALPGKIKCDDPRVTELKQLLQKIKSIIDRIRNILLILTTVVGIITVAATIGTTILNIQLALPLPSPPAVIQTVNVQNTLITNVISALKQIGITLAIVTGALTLVSLAVGPVINLLSKICSNEEFVVDSITEQSLLADVRAQIDEYPSKFYRTVNVSEQDIDNREDLITELLNQQRNILTDLLEAPSNVIISNDLPQSEQGKQGDYFIDTLRQIIYGPKLTDSEWGTGVNY